MYHVQLALKRQSSIPSRVARWILDRGYWTSADGIEAIRCVAKLRYRCHQRRNTVFVASISRTASRFMSESDATKVDRAMRRRSMIAFIPGPVLTLPLFYS